MAEKGTIENRIRLLEDKIYLSEDFARMIGKNVALSMSGVELLTTQAIWQQPVDIPLTPVRSTPQLFATFPKKPDCVVFLPDSTGTATIYLDDPGGHSYPMGTTYRKIRMPFENLYVENAAQAGMWMYLIVAKGDISILDYTMTPMDLQAQYRPVIATTTTLLTAAQIYTSDWYDCANFARVTLSTVANALSASAANGVVIQQSSDGTNPDYQSRWTTAIQNISGTNLQVCASSVELVARYARILYTNGALNQTVFRLTARARVV